MRFTDLQAFIDVVEAGGITQAAAAKGLSQPGVSRIVRELEKQVGAMLLRRTGRGVELTPAGAEFLGFAKESLGALHAVRRRVRGLSGAIPSDLRIAVPSRLGGILFPDLYRRFLAELPDVTILATEELSEDIAEGFAAGRLDAAISYLPSVAGAGDGTPLYRERLHLVGRGGVLGDTDAPIPMARLSDHPILLNGRASRYRRMIEAAVAAKGVKLTVHREIETAEGLLAFAAEGEGVTILPYSNLLQDLARGDIVARPIVDAEIERVVYLLIARRLDRHAVTRIAGVIRRALAPMAPSIRWRAI
jgi:LysR family nitrogen assimilation transcriptional regulator